MKQKKERESGKEVEVVSSVVSNEYLYSVRDDFENALDEEEGSENSVHVMKSVLVRFILTMVL